MKWKEPIFGATPMLKALTTANAHRKVKAFDLVEGLRRECKREEKSCVI
ncbi:hypothetical protein [Paenibacillus sp. 1-18]|nr:hypothetical protein [Paenibacillus sp. 1-18]